MKKMILAGLLLVLSTQSQLARADRTDDLLTEIKNYIGHNGDNDLFTKLDQLRNRINVLIDTSTAVEAIPPGGAERKTSLAANKVDGNTAANNAANAGRSAAPTAEFKSAEIQTAYHTNNPRQKAQNEIDKPILQLNPSVLDANGDPVALPVGGLSFNWTECATAADRAKKICAEDETHLANKNPNLWKDEASKKQRDQVALRAQEQAHKNNLMACKSEFEKLPASMNPDSVTCNGLNVDAATLASFKNIALPKFNNYQASIVNKAAHQDRVDAKNNEFILAQNQQKIIRLVLAERPEDDKSCNILDTKDLSILEPANTTPADVAATIATLDPISTAASITPHVSISGTYSNKYCSCIRLDAGGLCKEGKEINFASKKVNAEVTALDCKIEGGACKTTPVLIGKDSSGNPVYVNAIVKMTAAEKAAAIAAMTPAQKAANRSKTSSIAFY